MTARTRHWHLAFASMAFAAAALATQAARAEAPYLNGGIGEQEARSIETEQGDFNLRVVFSEGIKNVYATGVNLRIADAAGQTVLALNDAGPLTDVRVPPGRYAVDSHYGPFQRHDTVVVPKDTPVSLYAHFPRDAAPSK